MVSGGHNAVPQSIKLLHGTNRSDRDRVQKVKPLGTPTMPGDFDEIEAAHWELIVAERAGWLARSDEPALIMLCRTWAFAERFRLRLVDDLDDLGHRRGYLGMMVEWNKQAARFGLTPVDRERLGQLESADSKSALKKKYLG